MKFTHLGQGVALLAAEIIKDWHSDPEGKKDEHKSWLGTSSSVLTYPKSTPDSPQPTVCFTTFLSLYRAIQNCPEELRMFLKANVTDIWHWGKQNELLADVPDRTQTDNFNVWADETMLDTVHSYCSQVLAMEDQINFYPTHELIKTFHNW